VRGRPIGIDAGQAKRDHAGVVSFSSMAKPRLNLDRPVAGVTRGASFVKLQVMSNPADG